MFLLFLSQLGITAGMVSAFVKHGINGADIADCGNSDEFARLIPSVPPLQAKRCFRALTAYVDKYKSCNFNIKGGSDSSVVAIPRLPAATEAQVALKIQKGGIALLKTQDVVAILKEACYI